MTYRPVRVAPLMGAIGIATFVAVGAGLHAADSSRGPAVLHVDDDAPLGGDGATWETGFRHLQDALAAVTGDSEIRVAQGLYEPDRSDAIPEGTGDRFASFALATGVRVAGGYAGLIGEDPDERDVAQFTTVLSGDLARDDEPEFTLRDENSIHVLIADVVGASAFLDGCTIRGGNADGTEEGSTTNDRGGGLIVFDGSPHIVDCTFTDNRATDIGGGVETRGDGNPFFGTCTFVGNTADEGGGVGEVGGATSSFLACVFRENTARRGAGVRSNGTNFMDCSFEMNTAEVRGGAIYRNVGLVDRCDFVANAAGSGGAMSGGGMIRDSTFRENVATRGGAIDGGDMELVLCTFTDNEAERAGAVLFSGGVSVASTCTFRHNEATLYGGAVIADRSAVELSQCVFEENSAARGGAFLTQPIEQGSTTTVISECTFERNTASFVGGAGEIRFGAATTVEGCTFTDNAAVFAGGALYVNNTSPTIDDCSFEGNDVDRLGGSGGAIAIEDGSDPVISSCRFDENEAGTGGAISTFFASRPTITDSAFEANRAVYGAAMHNFIDGSPQVDNCTFERNEADEDGGAVWSRLCAASFGGCVFRENVSTDGSGGAAYLWQDESAFDESHFVENVANLFTGGVYMTESTVDLASCTFDGNIAIFQSAPALLATDGSTLTVTDGMFTHHTRRNVVEVSGGTHAVIVRATFVDNPLRNGPIADLRVLGAQLELIDSTFDRHDDRSIASSASDVTATNCTFAADLLLRDGALTFVRCSFADVETTIDGGDSTFDDCSFGGGEIRLDDGRVNMRKCILADARLHTEGLAAISACTFVGPSAGVVATGYGSASTIASSLFADCGSAISVSRGNHRVANCTLVDNTVGFSIAGSDARHLTLANTIVWNSPIPDAHDDVTLFYCDVESGWKGAGAGNFSADPAFVGVGDYRLGAESPCIDTGWDHAIARDETDRDGDENVTEFEPFDHAGEARSVDDDASGGVCGVVDVGAFERQGGQVQQPVPGDIDGDGRVGAAELLAILVAWGEADSCRTDVNADGETGFADLLMILLLWDVAR